MNCPGVSYSGGVGRRFQKGGLGKGREENRGGGGDLATSPVGFSSSSFSAVPPGCEKWGRNSPLLTFFHPHLQVKKMGAELREGE